MILIFQLKILEVSAEIIGFLLKSDSSGIKYLPNIISRWTNKKIL